MLRSGLVGDVGPSEQEVAMARHVDAILRLFSKDTARIAGRYARAKGRDEVTATDMRAALMYCARTFFEQHDEQLEARLDAELVEMDEEESSDDADGSDGGEASGEEDEASGEEDTGEEDEVSGEEDTGEEEDEERAMALVRHVDVVVAHWHLWQPTDPVHQLLKRSIDSTAVPDEHQNADDVPK